MAPPIGAVLCGGASRRMGVDKAAVEVDGTPMARRVADVLAAAGCSPVIAIGGNPTDTGSPRPRRRRRRDSLARVRWAASSQRSAVGAPTVVVACDLPDLRAATVAALIAALDGHDAAMAFSDRPEPLCAVWAESAAEVLREKFESGERAVHRALVGLDIAWVSVVPAELRNVNTPGDLRTL